MTARLAPIIGAALGGAIVFLLMTAANAYWWLPNARDEGRDLERTAILKRSMEIIQERGRTNAEIKALTDDRLCFELGGRWLPDEKLCE